MKPPSTPGLQPLRKFNAIGLRCNVQMPWRVCRASCPPVVTDVNSNLPNFEMTRASGHLTSSTRCPLLPRWRMSANSGLRSNALTMVLLALVNLDREGPLGWGSRARLPRKSFTVLLLAKILPTQIRAGAVGTIRDRRN